MSLSRFTRGLISSHISARSAPLWDQIEVAMMEPATGQEQKNARPGSLPAVPAAATTATNTTTTRPTAYVKDGKGRAGVPQPAAMAPRAERRRARREARAPHTTATMDESGLGGAPPEAEQPVYASWAERRRAGARPGSLAALVANGREAGRMTARRAQADAVDSDAGTLVRDNSASADAQETRGGPTFASWAERRVALGGARASPLPPPDAASASAARASPAGPSAPSPRETDTERPLWEWREAFADLEGLPSPADVAAVALDVGEELVESDTPRGRALESDTPWPPRAPRRERPRRRTAQAERAAAKSSAAQGSNKRQVNTSAAPQGQWSVARDPNVSPHPLLLALTLTRFLSRSAWMRRACACCGSATGCGRTSSARYSGCSGHTTQLSSLGARGEPSHSRRCTFTLTAAAGMGCRMHIAIWTWSSSSGTFLACCAGAHCASTGPVSATGLSRERSQRSCVSFPQCIRRGTETKQLCTMFGQQTTRWSIPGL